MNEKCKGGSVIRESQNQLPPIPPRRRPILKHNDGHHPTDTGSTTTTHHPIPSLLHHYKEDAAGRSKLRDDPHFPLDARIQRPNPIPRSVSFPNQPLHLCWRHPIFRSSGLWPEDEKDGALPPPQEGGSCGRKVQTLNGLDKLHRISCFRRAHVLVQRI